MIWKFLKYDCKRGVYLRQRCSWNFESLAKKKFHILGLQSISVVNCCQKDREFMDILKNEMVNRLLSWRDSTLFQTTWVSIVWNFHKCLLETEFNGFCFEEKSIYLHQWLTGMLVYQSHVLCNIETILA